MEFCFDLPTAKFRKRLASRVPPKGKAISLTRLLSSIKTKAMALRLYGVAVELTRRGNNIAVAVQAKTSRRRKSHSIQNGTAFARCTELKAFLCGNPF